jgi:hypothetical protein
MSLMKTLNSKITELNQVDEGIPIRDLGDAMNVARETIVKRAQIGSVLRGTVNYARGMKAFHNDDVPDHARTANA